MKNADPLIKLSDIHYAYPQAARSGEGTSDKFSIDIASLELYPGECVSLTGHNGSGKTTLGKLIVGLLRPQSGKVFFNGEDIADWELGKIGGHIGYLFQEPSRQIFAPTVLKEITFPLVLKGMEEEKADILARSMLSQFDMESMENAVTYTLSRGEKQRLAIAAMLVNNPSFIVLDEPTTGLDSRRKAILGDIIRKLTDQGIGILLISHDSDFVSEYASVSYCMLVGELL